MDGLERRGRQIAAALRDQALARGRVPFGEAAQRTVLEAIAALPPEVIDRVVQPDTTAPPAQPEPGAAAAAEKNGAAITGTTTGLAATPITGEHTRAPAAAGRSAAAGALATGAAGTLRPWERDFPTPIRAVLAATTGQAATAAHRPAIAHAAARAAAAQPSSRQAGPLAAGQPIQGKR